MDGSDESMLPASFDSVSTSILLHDPETAAVLDANEPAEVLYGHPVGRLRGLDVADFSADTARFSQSEVVRLVREAARGEDRSFEWHVKRADGELLWVEVRLSAETFDGEPYVLAEMHDITDRKRQERRLQLVNRILRHNLRNDMNVVMGNAELLRDAVENDTLTQRADLIVEVAEDLGQLSEDIERIERIAEATPQQGTATDVAEIVRAVAAGVEASNPHADVRVTVDATPRVRDNDTLRYALEHAVQNAIEHNDAQQPSVDIRVGERKDGRTTVTVTDDSPTIPAMELDALDPAVDSTPTSHGTGVGLWVMDWCVEALGGELVFEENDPTGNAVTFLLPALPAEDAD